MLENSSPSVSPLDSMPVLLFFGRDIFFAPVVKTAATTAGCRMTILPGIESLAKALQSNTLVAASVRGCILDLTPLTIEEISQWGEQLATQLPSARRIAFGPHVQIDKFQAATDAGFDPVLAKGQVASTLADLLS